MHTFKKLYSIVLLFTIGFSLSSCENDVDLNTEYREVTIVYGLLDQSTDRQYIKITKAFQTDGDVLLAAKDPKNSMYDPNDLEVSLDEYYNDTYRKTIYLDSVMITNKDTGDFYAPNEIVYATPIGVYLDEDYEYRLEVKVKSTGNIIQSRTTLVHDFAVKRPSNFIKYANFAGNYNQVIEWVSPKNGLAQQLSIRFFYTDVPVSGPNKSNYCDFVFPLKRATNTGGGDKMQIEFSGASFYQNLAACIPLPEAGMKRYADSLFYMFVVADEDFTIYLDINGPSTSVVQERPAYSNVSNGVGLFSSRYNKIRYFKGLNPKSLDELIKGQYTYQLGFVERP